MKSCTCQKTKCSDAGQISKNESEKSMKDVSNNQQLNQQSIFSNFEFPVDESIVEFDEAVDL